MLRREKNMKQKDDYMSPQGSKGSGHKYIWERSNPGRKNAHAKALGQKYASGVFEKQQGGQCDFIGGN